MYGFVLFISPLLPPPYSLQTSSCPAWSVSVCFHFNRSWNVNTATDWPVHQDSDMNLVLRVLEQAWGVVFLRSYMLQMSAQEKKKKKTQPIRDVWGTLRGSVLTCVCMCVGYCKREGVTVGVEVKHVAVRLRLAPEGYQNALTMRGRFVSHRLHLSHLNTSLSHAHTSCLFKISSVSFIESIPTRKYRK